MCILAFFIICISQQKNLYGRQRVRTVEIADGKGKRGRYRKRKSLLSYTGSLPKCMQWLEMSQAWSLEPGTQVKSLGEWQRPSHPNHSLLSHQQETGVRSWGQESNPGILLGDTGTSSSALIGIPNIHPFQAICRGLSKSGFQFFFCIKINLSSDFIFLEIFK